MQIQNLREARLHLSSVGSDSSLSSTVSIGGSQFNEGLPDYILEKIFLLLPGNVLVKTVINVCRRWQILVEDSMFWAKKLLVDGKLRMTDMSVLHELGVFDEMKEIYFYDLFSKNFLKNGCGHLGYDHWYKLPAESNVTTNDQFPTPIPIGEVIKNDAECNKKSPDRKLWSIEEDHQGAEKPMFISTSDSALDKPFNFVTSNGWGEKVQVVDLKMQASLIEDLIAKTRNDCCFQMLVSEDYASRNDWGSMYQINVFLVNEKFEMVDKYSFKDRMRAGTGGKWLTVRHVFYMRKTFRYILFFHGGMSNDFKQGYHGCKLTNGQIRFLLSPYDI